MEDLITIVIVVAAVAIKLFGMFKKNAPEPEADDSPVMSWDEFLDEVENNPELREAVESDPELQQGYEAAKLQQQMQAEELRKAQAERDAALLEQQRAIAEILSIAEETSEIYAQKAPEEENSNDPGDWAELIRNNRTEAIVISEILAPPAALR